VRTSGDKFRITAQLIRTADSANLWSYKYDRPLDDIFSVQDEIASAIVDALQINFMGGSLSRHEGGTENLDAYQLYLRALSESNKNTKSSLTVAVGYLEEAIKLDADYGKAWSELALTISAQADGGYVPAKESYTRARQLAQHALRLSPGLAEAHTTLAYLHQALDWNWRASEIEANRALAIDPANGPALEIAGLLASTLGRWEEADRQLHAALVRDPLDPAISYNLGVNYYLAGRLSDAEKVFRELLEREPDFPWTRRMLAKTLLAQGAPEAALDMLQQETDDANRMAMLPIVLQAVGRKAEADEALNALIQRWGETWPVYVAKTYAYRGEADSALEWLERAYKQNDVSLLGLVGEPLFKGLLRDSRYKVFLRKMNLPEPSDTT
jgi:serine/threonine-protein kinase